METLQEAILSMVQKNIKCEIEKELDNRLTYTGHGVVVKTLHDVKTTIHTYAMNEMDTATRKLYLLMN